MAIKSVSQEADEILLASAMISLGARLQVLESETSLSHDRLARLYREIRGCSPPKGMLPFSVDWFMTWLPNIHSSLFYNVFKFLNEHTGSKGVRAIIDAYRLYLEHAGVTDPEQGEPVLSFTRAWMLVRFFDGKMLQLSECRQCGGHFIAHAHDPRADFVCAICRPPPRAGKTRAAAKERAAGRRAAAPPANAIGI
jgi:flagellar transcriptional activator FlhC